MKEHSDELVKAKDEVIDIKVTNTANEDLGTVCELMLDKLTGQVAYVVLESGSFLGLGGKLFALPWNAINYDPNRECFVLNIDKEKLKKAPGFDKKHWPNMADKTWVESVSHFYDTKAYWE